ncbi:hypothetical protein [Bacillus sp. AK128]
MKLPILLSGPILRRVDPSSVSIWIATSRRFQIGAELFEIEQTENAYQYHLLSELTDTKTVKMGKRLYIHMITIKPMKQHFPTNTLLGYNLLFKRKSKTVDLNSFGLLDTDNPQSIVYGGLKYPSFYIQSGASGGLLYGSCNKLHGKDHNALASADLHLETAYKDLNDRPHSLFLLGDQIYADDVADPVFPAIKALSKKLVGKKERPEEVEARLNKKPYQDMMNKVNGRKYIMEQFCQFTSLDAHNHLITFGEYATMYLLSWSPELWGYAVDRRLIPTFEELIENEQFHFVFPNDDKNRTEYQKEHRQYEQRFNEQWFDIQENLHVLPRVRRLLANTPTYMMFDDHDITDDWNLSRNWVKNVWESSLGRHVVANGLGAYWSFQGWGNDPESFSPSFVRTIKKYAHSFMVGSREYQKWVNELWNYDSWHFVTPTEPKGLFLDTRTQRAFDSPPQAIRVGKLIEEAPRGPKLVNEQAWEKLTQSLRQSGWKKGDRLMIASPTPLYGIGLIESVLHSYVPPLRAIGIPVHELMDYEAWKYNVEGYTHFINKILEWKPSDCFILSGDVHYASNVKARVETSNGEQADIIQFTSSPVHNMSFSGIWGTLMKRVIWLNAVKRKKKEINRYCDSSYEFILDEPHEQDQAYHLKEKIQYLSTDQSEIIKIKNNIGLIFYSEDEIQNTLLQYNHMEKVQTSFERVNLSRKN